MFCPGKCYYLLDMKKPLGVYINRRTLYTVKDYALYVMVAVIAFGVFLFISARESIDSQIANLEIPEIPQEILEDMQSQRYNGEFNLGGYDWFKFYDPKIKATVEVKLTGLSSEHYDSLANQSIRIKFQKNDYRLKSISSEILYNSLQGQFSAFSEIGAYNVAKEVYPYVPNGRLVAINGDKRNIMIQWEDDFQNSIRENDFVLWNSLAKNYLYARDKQERYFDYAWNARDQTKNDLIKNFITLMEPIYDSLSKHPSEIKETNFDQDNYFTYLALSDILGSGHMDSHNLLFVPEIKKDQYIWNLALYDPAGLRYFLQPYLLNNMNPVSQYYLRDPYKAYLYSLKVDELNTSVLKQNRVSTYFDKIGCKNSNNYPFFSDMLLEAGSRKYAPIDLNRYCQLNDAVGDYETVRSVHLDNQLRESSLQWQLYWEGDDLYLSVHIPTVVGVEIKDIKCGFFSCKNKFELTNKTWWQEKYTLDDFFLLPELVREKGGWKASIIPGDRRYIYKWTGKGQIKPEDLNIIARNVVTGDVVYPVMDFYPGFKVDISDGARKNVFNLELKIVNPNLKETDNTSMIMVSSNIEEVSDIKDAKKDWSYVFNSNCDKKLIEGLKYELDCSKIDMAAWPYPITYSIEQHYKKMQVKGYSGEIYLDVTYNPTREVLSADSINKYKVTSKEEFLTDPTVLSYIKYFEGKTGTQDLSMLVNEADIIYLIPANSVHDINDDLELPDNSVIWFEKGVKIFVWPLVRFRVGTIIIAGNEVADTTMAQPPATSIVALSSLGLWDNLTIKKGGYFAGAEVSGTVSNLGGVVGEDIELVFANSIVGGKYNIGCTSCIFVADQLSISGSEWGINAKDSEVSINNLKAVNVDHVFILEDSVGLIKDVNASNGAGRTNETMDRIFELTGPFTDIKAENITAKGANIFVSKYLNPSFESKGSTLDEINYETLDLDREDIYKNVIEMSADSFAKTYPIFRRDKSNSALFILEGKKHTILKDILVPKNVEIKIEPGAKIEFGNKDGMIVYGKITALGTEEKPITFTTVDKNESWGVLALRGSQAQGIFEHVFMERSGQQYLTGTSYSGAISAHKGANLVVQNSVFKNSTGDDAINCVNAICTIKHNVFEKNGFDGVDFDFSTGEIAYNKFIDNGNDGIDISFDKSVIYNNEIIGSGDKGISVGEGSGSVIYNNLIEGGITGIEIKDNSKEIVVNNTIRKNKVGINAYLKKKSFKFGGQGYIYNTEFTDNIMDFQTDRWSFLDIKSEYNSEILEQLDLNKFSHPIYGRLQ